MEAFPVAIKKASCITQLAFYLIESPFLMFTTKPEALK